MYRTMDTTDWQMRARLAGLNQRMLARLTGGTETTVSKQLRGHWGGQPPQYVQTIITAYGLMTPDQRAALLAQIEAAG